MARLKTVGFEQNTLDPDSELFFAFGNPIIVTNIAPASGLATLWNDATATWDDVAVPWGIETGDATYEPEGVRSGYYAARVQVGDFFDIKASSKGGGGYNRIYIKIKTMPDAPTAMCYFIRDTDDVNIATVELQPDGRLRFHYRNDAGVKTYLGDYSNPLQIGRYYAIEMGIFGNEVGTNRTFECRIDHLRFMQASVTDQSSYDGYFGSGPNYDADDDATVGSWYCDDLATNDGYVYDWDDNNSWCGPGKCILLPVMGDDQDVGVTGWTRGGSDSGFDWKQVKDSTPPDDGSSYLIGHAAGNRADFRIANPYDAGIRNEDIIKAMVANVRWSMENDSDGSDLHVYLRAGSNLVEAGNDIFLFGTDWFTADASGRSPDVFSTNFLPESTARWTPEDVARARIGMVLLNTTIDVYVTSMWVYVDYVPYGEDNLDYSLTINGVDRTTDLEFQSLTIQDQLNEQANTADFSMYNLHDIGFPQTDDTVEVIVNGVKLFSGYVLKKTYNSIGNLNDKADISCIDHTRILDRRMVSATYVNMTDKEIIETIISQFVYGEGVGTYYVAEGVTVSQISFNYIPVSQAIKQLAELTSRSWYIDYNKQIHYFSRQAAQAPFAITETSAYHKNLQVTEDASRLRNRIFVRGGTELTTTPIVERLVADGEQRVFLIAEKPHDIIVMVDGVMQTVGIKNVHSPDDYDWLMSFQEKYIEAGTFTVTPTVGAIVEVSYNYDVPILVSVEDSDSVRENGIYEYAIVDNQIANTQQARDRAIADLTDYANDIIDASYQTYAGNLRSGQYQRMTLPRKDIDEDYLVNTITLRSLGGGRFVTDVKLTNAKTMGIIKFLMELLQLDRRVGQLDPNEKVDQLFTVEDVLDSFIDSLVIDSNVTNFKWAADSYSPGTRPGNVLKYSLGQWS